MRASRASAYWPCRTSAPSRATAIRWVTKTASTSRRSRAAVSSRYRARDGRSRPASSSLAIRVRPGSPCRCRSRTYSAATARYVGFRKYQSRVGAFNRFLRANGSTEEERELVAAKLVGRWRSGAPLTLAPDADNPALGADPQRNNNFDYANDPHGRQGALRKPHPAHEPAGHETHPSDRRQHPSPHQARHDVWTTLRSERAVRSR